VSLLHDNLNNAAETAPEQDAFRCGQQSLTYSELHRDAGRLAALLTDLGVEQSDCVAICMPPCVESATAVYGIMKAGAAFVPIDPHAPDHRL
jgi:non-ribosomal peptide synthetase component F